jgi:hypothetical protein
LRGVKIAFQRIFQIIKKKNKNTAKKKLPRCFGTPDSRHFLTVDNEQTPFPCVFSETQRLRKKSGFDLNQTEIEPTFDKLLGVSWESSVNMFEASQWNAQKNSGLLLNQMPGQTFDFLVIFSLQVEDRTMGVVCVAFLFCFFVFFFFFFFFSFSFFFFSLFFCFCSAAASSCHLPIVFSPGRLPHCPE